MRSLEAYERVVKLSTETRSKFKQVKVVSFEVQPKYSPTFDGLEHHLTDNRYIHFSFDNYILASSTSNFFQVNSYVASELYSQINKRFKDESIKVSVDLFCGVAFSKANISRFVYGIEINIVAIDCANYSLKLNCFSNIKFICDDANNFKNHIIDDIDLVVINPPRRGIEKNFVIF